MCVNVFADLNSCRGATRGVTRCLLSGEPDTMLHLSNIKDVLDLEKLFYKFSLVAFGP